MKNFQDLHWRIYRTLQFFLLVKVIHFYPKYELKMVFLCMIPADLWNYSKEICQSILRCYLVAVALSFCWGTRWTNLYKRASVFFFFWGGEKGKRFLGRVRAFRLRIHWRFILGNVIRCSGLWLWLGYFIYFKFTCVLSMDVL